MTAADRKFSHGGVSVMVLDYVVTFEFSLDPPITRRGTVVATSAQTCARLAVKEAKDKTPRVKWSSLVVVLTQKGLLDKKSVDSNADDRGR